MPPFISIITARFVIVVFKVCFSFAEDHFSVYINVYVAPEANLIRYHIVKSPITYLSIDTTSWLLENAI